MAYFNLEVFLRIFNENKTHHQKAETDAKILVCLGCLKIPNKDFKKSTHTITGYPLDPGRCTAGFPRWHRQTHRHMTHGHNNLETEKAKHLRI